MKMICSQCGSSQLSQHLELDLNTGAPLSAGTPFCRLCLANVVAIPAFSSPEEEKRIKNGTETLPE